MRISDWSSDVCSSDLVRSNRAMNVIAALLESRTGQQIDASRAWRIETALKPVLRARGIETLDGLVTRILDGRAPELAAEVVDALLNQESSFFRDTQVVEMVADAAARLGRDTRPEEHPSEHQ